MLQHQGMLRDVKKYSQRYFKCHFSNKNLNDRKFIFNQAPSQSTPFSVVHLRWITLTFFDNKKQFLTTELNF